MLFTWLSLCKVSDAALERACSSLHLNSANKLTDQLGDVIGSTFDRLSVHYVNVSGKFEQGWGRGGVKFRHIYGFDQSTQLGWLDRAGSPRASLAADPPSFNDVWEREGQRLD